MTYETSENVFAFPISYQVGKGDLSVVFTGELNDKMKGFYRSKYTGPDGEDRYAAVTQFEVILHPHCAFQRDSPVIWMKFASLEKIWRGLWPVSLSYSSFVSLFLGGAPT